jgi:hypothetical protein
MHQMKQFHQLFQPQKRSVVEQAPKSHRELHLSLVYMFQKLQNLLVLLTNQRACNQGWTYQLLQEVQHH